MTNKRLILTIGGLLLGVSQISAMTNFKRFAPVLVGVAAVAQTQVIKAEGDTFFAMNNLPYKFFSVNKGYYYNHSLVDTSGYSAKQIILALYQKANPRADQKNIEAVKKQINGQFEIDKQNGSRFGFGYLNNTAINVDIDLKTRYLSGAAAYEEYNRQSILREGVNFREAVKNLKPVADQEFKRCSSDKDKRKLQYNADYYQSTRSRKKLANLFDEGFDICRGGDGEYYAKLGKALAKYV